MLKLTFKIFICSLFLAYNFSATIRGKIYDQNSGNALVGANVYLENTSLGGSTNVDGQYIITDIPNNSNYTITVKYLGYKEYSQEFLTANFYYQQYQETLHDIHFYLVL